MKTIIKQFITQELVGHRVPQLTEEDNLLLDGMVDSLGMLQLVAFIEDTFLLKIPYEDITIENFCNIRNLTTYVERQAAA